jgi:hypothetical protein
MRNSKLDGSLKALIEIINNMAGHNLNDAKY